MPLTIEWSPSARRDLARIIEYIAADNPAAAQKLRERLEGVVSPLAEHPYLFRPGRVAGTREIVAHPNYIVVYRILSDRIRVSAVLHARQQYPK